MSQSQRLKELYLQASEQARKLACEKKKTDRPQNNTVWNEFPDVFAELIIRECMELADKALQDGKWPGDVLRDHFEIKS
jgi:hypothetical protein